MTAFASLIVLTIIAALALSLVAYSNYKVEQTKKTRHKLQQLRAKAEELEDMTLAMDLICETRMISKLVNEEIIDLYENMLEIDSKATFPTVGLANAKLRSEELSNELAARKISRLCNSDAQIARLHAYIDETCKILRRQQMHGKISASELHDFTNELLWYSLQVDVVSNIVQGHKAFSKQDFLTSNAFYKKAQKALVASSHPDPRRQKMIDQVADLIFGKRLAIDEDLMPESDYNPNASKPTLGKEQSEILEELLSDADPSMIPQITAAFMEQNLNDANNANTMR